MVALSVYPCNLAATTITTANQLLTGSGATNTNRSSKVGTSTGYSECYSQGTGNAWASAGSVGAQSGHGWLLDSTLLEQQQISAGNWTPSIRFAVSVGSLVCDFIVRFSVRSSGGVYTTIGSITLTGQTVTTTTTEYNLAATAFSAQNFNAGDKLYVDIWANVTSNSTGSASANLNCSMASSSTQGSTQIVLATPGYIGQSYTGTVEFDGVGTLAESAQAQSAATVTGVGTLTESAQAQGTATLAGVGTLQEYVTGPATLAGASQLMATGYVTHANAEVQPYGLQLDPAWHLVGQFRPTDIMEWAKQYTFGNTATFNGEVETYLPGNVYIDSATGDLVLEGRNTGGGDPSTGYNGKYTSGMVASYNAMSYKYGYIEGRIKLPAGIGVWPAFWQLLTTISQSNELDIVEIFETATVLHRGIHYEQPIGTKFTYGGQNTVVDMSQAFHYFALEWTPEGITFYFDGVALFTSSEPDMQPPGVMYVLMNLALGGVVTTGLPPDSVFPIQYRCEYIRLWQRSDPAFIFTLTPQAPAFGNFKIAALNYAPAYYYRCDEASGTVAVDQSGNGNNGTYAATGVTLQQPGLLIGDADQSVKFDGVAGYIGTNFDPTGLTKLSVLASFSMPTVITNDGRFIASSHTDANNNGFQQVIRANGAGGLVSIGWGTNRVDCFWSLANNALLQANTTYWYGFSWDGKFLNVYLNGALIGTANNGSASAISSSGFTVNIGRGPYNNDYCAVVADEVLILPNKVLAASDFLALYNRASTAPAHAPIATITDSATASAAISDIATA